MNRLWAAAGLLAVLITICTLAVISTQSITTSITQDIALIADTSLQDDKDTALTLSRQAGEKWQNHHAGKETHDEFFYTRDQEYNAAHVEINPVGDHLLFDRQFSHYRIGYQQRFGTGED